MWKFVCYCRLEAAENKEFRKIFVPGGDEIKITSEN
jgi:hypothetical protein